MRMPCLVLPCHKIPVWRSVFWICVDAKGHSSLDWQDIITRQNTLYNNFNASNQSLLGTVFVLLRDTAVYFLHTHEIGTKV